MSRTLLSKSSKILKQISMKEVLSTSEGIYRTMTNLHDSEGQELFISMEGIALLQPEVFATKKLCQLKYFPIYLLGGCGSQQYNDGGNNC